jgi:hypothetical protein
MSPSIPTLSSPLSSTGSATGLPGLFFGATGASYDGQPVTLAEIQSDTSGRFSDGQKLAAGRLQNMQAAIDQLQAAQQQETDGTSASNGTETASFSEDSVVLSLSPAALQRLGGASGADTPPPAGVVAPKLNFSNSIQSGGFTLSVTANAEQGSYNLSIDGPNGFQITADQLDHGEAGGGSGVTPLGMSTGPTGDTAADNVISITVYTDIAASATEAVSSAAGSSSQTDANAETAAYTFTIDFNTGALSVAQSSVSASTTATQSTTTGAAAPAGS